MTSTIANFQSFHVIRIDQSNRDAYVTYCRKHRYDHDESDLYEEDLLTFDPEASIQPTFGLQAKSGQWIGMVSVRILPYLGDKKRGRIAILHSEYTVKETYEALLEAILPDVAYVDHLFCFLPEKQREVSQIIQDLQFSLDRYVWVLVREDLPINSAVFPKGYSLLPYRGPMDAADWCLVRNDAFQTLRGSETPLDEAGVVKMTEEACHVDGGMLILRDEANQAIGIIRVAKELEEGIEYAFIGPVAVRGSHQGKGFGRMLLRAGLQFGFEQDIDHAMLCVNADNSRAADLYLSEGFQKNVVMICYKREVHQNE